MFLIITLYYTVFFFLIQVDEVPYLLAKADAMDRLKATILNIAVFQRLMKTEDGKYQLIKSWQLVREQTIDCLNKIHALNAFVAEFGNNTLFFMVAYRHYFLRI